MNDMKDHAEHAPAAMRVTDPVCGMQVGALGQISPGAEWECPGQGKWLDCRVVNRLGWL